MDGSALNGNHQQGSSAWNNGFPIKSEELPQYTAVAAPTEHQQDDFTEMQRLSQEYTPDVTVRGALNARLGRGDGVDEITGTSSRRA
jgi:hypothetical protein